MFNRLFATRKRPYIPHRHEREHIEIDLSGNVLSLDLLPHTDYEGFGTEPAPKLVNIYDNDSFQSDEHLPDWKREGNSFCFVHKRSWELRGPIWRSRPLGSIDFAITVGRQDVVPAGVSFFNPAHFEQLALRSAYFNGPAQPEFAKVQAPIHWRLIEKSGVTWIYYETHRDLNDSKRPPLAHEASNITSTLFLPVEDHHYILISFRYLGYAPVSQCLAAMDELRDSVCSSIELELSESSKKQCAQAKNTATNQTAQQQRPPEPWIYPKWRNPEHHKGESEIMILKPGSPAPEFTP